MLGHPLITKAMSEEDSLGTILSVVKDNNNYILEGRLLFPTRIKNNLITGATIERLTWEEPIEVFDTLGEDKQLVGAGKLERQDKDILFTIKIISDSHCKDIIRAIKELGSNAFERFYPVFPILTIKEDFQICNICDNPLGKDGCTHELGKVYLRTYCRAKILDASVQTLAWSGVKQFQSMF